MAKFKIYSKDGQTVRYEGCPRYNGTYLKVSYLEFSSIASPSPIKWQVGDYVDYPRTGLRYTLRSIPSVRKTAKAGQTGDAFVYQNVQFMAQTQDLVVAPFIDLVPNDNGVHFSTQSAVSTFENAYGIAARIQACLDDLFPGVWEVKVYESLDEDFAKRISEAADFSIDGGTCLEACDRMYDTWGIGWTHYKDSSSGKDVLLFGRPNTRTSENTSAEFVFGPGNGLTAIKRAVANADEIGTRLRVFGSSRNMLPAYYRDLDIHNAESVDIQNLMIPTSKWGKTEGKPDARKAYLQASDEVVERLGLIPRTHYFDGSNGGEIYPSLEGVTIGDIRAAKEEMQDATYVPTIEIYPSNSERADEIKAVTNPEDDGYSGGSDGSKYKATQTVSFAGVNRQQVLVSSNVRPEQYDDPVTVSWLIFNGVALKGDRALTVDSGLEGYIEDPNKIIEPYEKQLTGRLILSSGSGDNSNYASADIIFHKDGTYYRFTLPSVTLENPADYTDISLRLEISAKATRSANTYFYVTLSGWDFLLGESTPVTNVFTLALKQIGFDIAQRASFTSDGLARVYMKDGMNAGRSFYVKTCSFDSPGDQWLLGMYRTEDESTGMRYPNSQYPIKPGDHFVLLDIAMPELYIGLASQRLYEKGQEMLGGISRIKPYYEPEVDAKVMTEQARVLREGMYMRLTDADVSAALTEYVLIDTLTISEGDAAIPIYKVSLREYKKKTFQETTKAAIDNISQKASGGPSGRPSSSAEQSYGALSDKPKIDGVTLEGNRDSYNELGLINKSIFELVNIGTEESPLMAIRAKYGLFSNSFISARGSDPEAGSGGGGSGVDMESVWYALAQPTSEKINVSHLSANNVARLLTAAGYKLTDTTYGLATDTVSGLIKTGYAENGKNYAVKLDGTGKAYVNVPWTDKFDTYFGVDGDGNIYVKDNRGFYGNSFVSARGSDPEAGQGSGGGLDVQAMWYALGQPTNEKINVSHIPSIGMDKVTGLQSALNTKLESITKPMVEAVLTGTITSHNHDGRYAPLSGGLIPSQYLPSYVDDVLEYASKTAFPATGEAGKIYVALDTNLTYRWGGSAYVEISPSLALGHTSSTAYPGDEGAALAALVEGMKEITDLFGIDEDGNVYVKDGKGFYGTSFVSARGSDPLAGSSGAGGLDIDAMWEALAAAGTQKINASHIPLLQQLSGQITNAQLANSSLSVAGVNVALGGSVTTAQIASALTAAGYKLTDTVTTLASLGITATAAELNKLDGLATTATELGYVHGVTSNIQTQLNGKASASALSGYLPLTGGTMTGLLNLKYSRAGLTMLDITNTAGGEVFYRMYSGSTYAGAFTTNHKSYGTAIFNAIAGQLYLGITNSGVPHFQGNTLLHSGNYTNYTVTKTGGGASGSWGISISGIANRAVYLTSTYTGSGGLQPPSYFNGMGLKVNMMNRPVSYCDVIVVNGYGGQGSDVPYINALAFQKTANTHGEVYHARGDYGGSSWGTWYKFLDSGNYADYTVTKTGGGASGMWPISVSGSSNTLISTTVTAISNYVRYRQIVGQTSLVGSNAVNGAWCLPTTGGDAQYGNGQILRFGWAPSYYTDLHTGPNEIGSASGLQFRQVIAGAVSKLGWRTLLDTANYAGYLDTRYLQKSSYTASDILAKLKTVDGSGSGLDADLLDGYHATSLSRLLSYINSGTKAAAGWYRVFTASSGRTDALGENIILHLARSYNHENNEAYTFCISVAYNNQVNITQVSGLANVRLITKIRVVSVPFGALYVDFYLSTTTNGNTYYVSGTGPGTFQEAAAVSTAGGNVTEFETVNGIGNSGNITASGTIHAATGIWSNGYVSAKGQDTTSDARYKRDVAALPAQAALAVLMRLRPATWAWKDDGRRGAGFVAQEVLGVLPEAVREVGDGEDRHLALNYQMLHAYEVCLLQTHETELERLRGRVNQLEAVIQKIKEHKDKCNA